MKRRVGKYKDIVGGRCCQGVSYLSTFLVRNRHTFRSNKSMGFARSRSVHYRRRGEGGMEGILREEIPSGQDV